MAIYIYTISALRTILAVGALICVSAMARADLVYHLTICGGDGPAQPGSACFVRPANSISGSVDGEALAQFYDSHGIDTPHPLHPVVLGGNQAGLAFGSVFDADAFLDASFISDNGNVVCCTADSPFRITGLNDAGTFIGNDDPFPFATTEFDAFSVAPKMPVLDAASLQFLAATLPDTIDPQSFFAGAELNAIDNAGRISGDGWQLGAFLLAPDTGLPLSGPGSAVFPAPEPGSLALLGGALGLLGLLRRRRQRIALGLQIGEPGGDIDVAS